MTELRRAPRVVIALLFLTLASCAASQEQAGNCLEVVLTGTQGGPPAVNGLAGAGTLVRYGSSDSHCNDVVLQFDAGRGTTERLSQLGISPNNLDAVFLTHLHSDHTEGLIGLLQLRWHFMGGPVDVVCSDDAAASKPPPDRVMSCRGYTEHIGDAFVYAGEVAQRHAENRKRDSAGPASLVRLRAVELPLPTEPGTIVWESGDVKVSAVGTTHIAGSLAYRVDTPAGSVVIGGDAGSSVPAPPRASSTSEAVEALAAGADILVHSVIHPVFAPGAGSTFPPPVYLRQSNVADLAALAERAGVRHLLLTHLIPALDSPSHGPFLIPGGPLQADDFEVPVRDSGYEGRIYVGHDLLSIRIP
jgi:ribonuclease Z